MLDFFPGFLSFFLILCVLSCAVVIPFDVSVNSQCSIFWSGDSTTVQWRGRSYTVPPSFFISTNDCVPSGYNCLDRLWCTSTGVVGYITPFASGYTLYVMWLEGDSVHRVTLQKNSVVPYAPRRQEAIDVKNFVMAGSRLVVVSRRMFDTVLFTANFGEYDPTVQPEQLISVRAHDMNQIHGVQNISDTTLIYRSGRDAITLSQAIPRTKSFIETVLTIGGDSAVIPLIMHVPGNNVPLTITSGRDTLATPEYACKTSIEGPSLCYIITTGGRYSWAYAAKGAPPMFTIIFNSGLPSFSLPDSIWFLTAPGTNSQAYLSLVSPLGPLIAFNGPIIWAIEVFRSDECESGYQLALMARDIRNDFTPVHTRTIGCEYRIISREDSPKYSGVSNFITRWGGPWEDGQLLVSQFPHSQEYSTSLAPSPLDNGTKSARHIFNFHRRGVVIVPDGDSRLTCFWAERDFDGVHQNYDIAIFPGVVEEGSVSCVRSFMKQLDLSPNYVDKNGYPILLHSSTLKVATLLLDMGADIEAKAPNGETLLIHIVSRRVSGRKLVSRGASICTFPIDVFSTLGSWMTKRSWIAELEPLAMNAPCEVGFYLQNLPRCLGLTPCIEGHFCPGYLNATNQPIPCPVGTYGPKPFTYSSIQCRPCPPQRPFSYPGSTSIDHCTKYIAILPGDEFLTGRRAEPEAGQARFLRSNRRLLLDD